VLLFGIIRFDSVWEKKLCILIKCKNVQFCTIIFIVQKFCCIQKKERMREERERVREEKETEREGGEWTTVSRGEGDGEHE